MVETKGVLFVDLSAGTARVDEIDLGDILGLGGKLLGVRLLEKYLGADVDPLSPENVIVLTPSRISAYGMSGSDRFGAFTRSPLTGIWLESYCGGTFARTLCETGWDAVVIGGGASSPTHVNIDTRGAHFLPAADLWGKDTFTVEAQLLPTLGKRSAMLCIGVAGENLVKVASVMHEQAHTLGRGGMGAVFGSKMLKVVSATSPGPAKREAADDFIRTRREVSQLAVDSPTAVAYRTYGTPMMVHILNDAGSFPTDFFLKATAPHRSTLEAPHWPDWATIETETCPPCPLRCRKRLTLHDGPEAGRTFHGPEYETLYTLGGSCMVTHARDVARLNERCNVLGMDTISGGNLAAVAIKAKQLGKIDEGPDPGDVEGISALFEAIANRSTQLGDLLAQGMDDALAALDMREWSITSKRLDPAGYEPRRLPGMALSYAVSVRGACHLRATFYKAELGGLLDDLDDESYVRTYVDWEDRMSLLDGLTMCRFYRDFLSWERLVSCVTQLNGAPVTQERLEHLCADTTTRIRRLNLSFGATPADDTVAERFFIQSTEVAPALDREELHRRVRLYWALRGWTEEGLLPA